MGRLTVHEAAARVGRSVGTVRAWVRAGRLVGAREAGPSGRLTVDEAALLLVAAAADPRGAHEAAPAPPALPPAPAPTAAELGEALARAAAAEARVEALGEALAEARARAAAEARRADEARLDLAHAREHEAALRAELAALRAAGGASWWRRLLTG